MRGPGACKPPDALRHAQLARRYRVEGPGTLGLVQLEASALRHSAAVPTLAGRSPLLRLQSDERLIALTRRGNSSAFEALVQRYQPRLLAFCRHMLGSQEDAEDVLQEVFAASYNALLADERAINARPWLYRIARNRCLNHLRRPQPAGQDSMDVFERDGGTTTADTVHRREEFRQIVSDVQELPETQRTALLLREIDALSYEQIAEAMDTTVPSVKSLLVRARVSLAEAAEARLLTCGEVRLELGQVAEGLARSSAPVRRHLRRLRPLPDVQGRAAQDLQGARRCLSDRAIAGAEEAVGGQGRRGRSVRCGRVGRGRRRRARGTGMAGAAAGAAGAAGGITAGGAVSAGVSALASKAAAGMAAAVIVTAGAVEVRHRAGDRQALPPASQVAAAPAPAPAQPVPAAPVEVREAGAGGAEGREARGARARPRGAGGAGAAAGANAGACAGTRAGGGLDGDPAAARGGAGRPTSPPGRARPDRPAARRGDDDDRGAAPGAAGGRARIGRGHERAAPTATAGPLTRGLTPSPRSPIFGVEGGGGLTPLEHPAAQGDVRVGAQQDHVALLVGHAQGQHL